MTFMPETLQDVLDLSTEQKAALVAARRKLLATMKDIVQQRKQVRAATLTAGQPMSWLRACLLTCARSPS